MPADARSEGRGDRARRWPRKLAIAGGILAVLVGAGLLGWQLLMAHFIAQYYRDTYAPIELADVPASAPARHHLDDVPWYSTQETYCAATSLQMIAAQNGMAVSRDEVSFLMGFSYGAATYQQATGLALNPFTDPEAGHAVAAPYLDLVRRYHVTADEKLYLRALRHYLSQGYALRLPLDYAVLHGLPGFVPHSDVLVGYDESGFYYYETVCLEGVPCQPGERPPGEAGLYVSDQVLVRAVGSQAAAFRYPWRYAFTLFEPGPAATDLKPIWARNGASLAGGARYEPRQGADAVEALAADLSKRGAKADLAGLRFGLESAAYTRRDDAAFLRRRFADDAGIVASADALERAAAAYEAALVTVKDGPIGPGTAARAAGLLREAASAEREAGRILLQRGI